MLAASTIVNGFMSIPKNLHTLLDRNLHFFRINLIGLLLGILNTLDEMESGISTIFQFQSTVIAMQLKKLLGVYVWVNPFACALRTDSNDKRRNPEWN